MLFVDQMLATGRKPSAGLYKQPLMHWGIERIAAIAHIKK
jgi:hypothetical protein